MHWSILIQFRPVKLVPAPFRAPQDLPHRAITAHFDAMLYPEERSDATGVATNDVIVDHGDTNEADPFNCYRIAPDKLLQGDRIVTEYLHCGSTSPVRFSHTRFPSHR